MPERMNARPMMGVTTAPTALKDCARFSRRSEDSGGPRMVTYGLAATSSTPCPQAITNNAKRKKPYSPIEAAGMNRKDRKSTRLNSSHLGISYAVFCLKKKIGATDTT